MSYPFHLLENEKIPAPAQDVETFIRHTLGQHWFIVERTNLDDTDKRFELRFWQRHIGLDRYMEDGKIGKIYWGGAEIIEWSNSTEIIRMWAATLEDWYIGIFNLDRDKEMEKRFEQLEELSNEIREHFKQPASMGQSIGDNDTAKPEKPRIPVRGSSIEIWFDYYHAMNKAGYKMTFEMLSKESGYSKNTFKVEHKRYKLERGIDLPNS